MSRKEKRRKMLSITRQWEQNSISQKTFSQANGIKLYTLRYWISKNQQQQNFSSGFIQLNEPAAAVSTTTKSLSASYMGVRYGVTEKTARKRNFLLLFVYVLVFNNGYFIGSIDFVSP